MSETFWLWNPTWEPETRVLTFFALQANLATIARGTADMIAEMLTDMGWPDAPVERWQVRRALRSSFHAQYPEDEPGQAWDEVWAPSWEIAVSLPGRAAPPPGVLDPLGETGTFAMDDTAQGDVPFPAEGLVLADFESPAACEAALDVLREALGMRALEGPPRNGAAQRVLAAVRKRFGGRPSSARLEQRGAGGRRALVWFGAFREDDDAATAALGDAVETLCRALGARTRLIDT